MDNTITISGNLVADPELRFTPAGAAVTNFRIAYTPRTFNRETNQWEDGDAVFLTCNLWGNPARNVADSLTKGARVLVTGKVKQRSFQTREGDNRTVIEIDVDDVGASMKYATVTVERAGRDGAGSASRGGSADTPPWGGAATQEDEPPF